MSGEFKNFVIISASPRVGEDSTSDSIASLGEGILKSDTTNITRINVRKSISKKQTQADYTAMLGADALIIIFPLYFFCLPGLLIRFLQDYDEYYRQHKGDGVCSRVYTVINCGFPEADINKEALRVIKSFSRKTGNMFRFGLLLGGGGMLHDAKESPFMRKTMAAINNAFARISEDTITCGEEPLDDIYASLNFPRRLYFFIADRGWLSSAKKNGLSKKDLYRKPYREA